MIVEDAILRMVSFSFNTFEKKDKLVALQMNHHLRHQLPQLLSQERHRHPHHFHYLNFVQHVAALHSSSAWALPLRTPCPHWNSHRHLRCCPFVTVPHVFLLHAFLQLLFRFSGMEPRRNPFLNVSSL